MAGGMRGGALGGSPVRRWIEPQPARACSTASQNASRSSGFLDVIRFRSTITSSSTHLAPAFSRSFRTDGHEVRRRPRTTSASIRSCGP
jgi:hypothetical protein